MSQQPPLAEKRPFPITTHNHTRTDNYHWLREKSAQEVLNHLHAENSFMESQTAHTTQLQQALFEEMVAHIQETDSTAPVKQGSYRYYSRTEEGKQYSIYCRQANEDGAAEQILLDLNQLAEGHDYLRLGAYEISPNGNLLAFGLDTTGAETYTIQFKELSTGELLPDTIEGATDSAAWGNDNATFLYTTEDEAKRSYKLFRHVLGKNGADEELFHEPDALFSVYVYKTRDDAYLVLDVASIETTEAHLLDANAPQTAVFQLVTPRDKNVQYQVNHRNGTLYIVTNWQAQNFRLMIAPAANPSRDSWQEMIPHRPSVMLDDVDLFANQMVLHERKNGLTTMRVFDFATSQFTAVSFPEPVYTYEAGSNPEFNSDSVRIEYTSLTTSDSDYDINLSTLDWTLIKQEPVRGGYDANNYVSQRIFATAKDSTQIPISLVHRRDVQPSANTPLILYGYGSYGVSIDPYFDKKRLIFLDRGFVYAIAHVRGGQEMGRAWYDNGKFLHKKNSFTDFIACGHHLIAQGYTSSAKMIIIGRSAGGLLMGAVLNMAPNLAHIAVAGVPFVDVVTTMLDESIPLTVGEFDEWGNPKDKTYYDYMLSYSPYDNIEAKAYPNILVTAGLNDPRVQYWEPAKWVAKLRELKTNNNKLLFKVHMGAGHFSSSGRYDYLKDYAFEYAFILDTLGIRSSVTKS